MSVVDQANKVVNHRQTAATGRSRADCGGKVLFCVCAVGNLFCLLMDQTEVVLITAELCLSAGKDHLLPIQPETENWSLCRNLGLNL